MAGAFTRANAFQLDGRGRPPPTEGELYIAHFLGPDGAGTADQRRRLAAAAPAPQRCFRRRRRQPRHLLRQVGQRPQRRRCLCQADRQVRQCARGALSPAPTVQTQCAHRAGGRHVAAIPVAATVAGYRRHHAGPRRCAQQDAIRCAGFKPLFQAMFTRSAAARRSVQTVASLWTPSRRRSSGARARPVQRRRRQCARHFQTAHERVSFSTVAL